MKHVVSPTGTLVGSAFPVATNTGDEEAVDVTFDGDHFRVLISSADGLRGRQISPTGDILSEEPLFTPENVHSEAAAAFGGEQYLIVWMEGTDGAYVVKGRLVPPVGEMGSVLTLSEHDSFYYNPVCVAYGAGRFMVVWHYNADENDAWDLRGRIVLADGALGSNELMLADGPNAEFAWANNVVFDGQYFLAVWTDYEGEPPAGQGTVLGRYWNTEGLPMGASFTVADKSAGQLGVGLSNGGGKVLSLINPGAFTQNGDVCARFITRPFVQVGSAGPQGIEMSFNGVLEYSTNLETWLKYNPQPSSPWTNQIGNGNMFFRARAETNSTAP